MAVKVLYITQEIFPYLPESEIANKSRQLPQAIQELGREIRTFMPKYGCVNERRNQLHEVIRLSGMNLIIDDTDHQLIIKVASIPAARIQVYFIDNEEFFKRRFVVKDEAGNDFADNDERAIFFARGVLETVKKLRWTPDIIHCHGWMSAIVPVMVKTAYHDDPFFDKLVSISLPRVRDFRGVNPNSFDGRGNYTIGIKEQLIFPEIVYDKVFKVRGMDIVIVTTAKTDEEGRALLSMLGMPFRK